MLGNYNGGKGNIFRHLINQIPPHHSYIESFLGGGSVMLLTMVATGSPAAIVAIVAKSRPMLGVFSLCVMVVWFVFRAIGREIRRQR